VDDVREIIATIKAWSKQASKITKLLNTYEEAHALPVDNAYVIEKKIKEIETAVAALPDPNIRGTVNTWLNNEKTSVGKLKEDFRFRFGQQLKALFEKDGVGIRGQYPLLRLGLFTLKLNFEFGEATLFFGPEVDRIKAKIPLHPKTIYDIVCRCRRDMEAKPVEPDNFYDDIYAAYQRCLRIAGKSLGDKVLVTDVLKEYVFLKQPKRFVIDPSKGHFHEYSRVKLSYMLYRLKNTDVGTRGLRFHVATFDATVDKLRSFWIPDNEEGEGTHYEYLSFEKPHD